MTKTYHTNSNISSPKSMVNIGGRNSTSTLTILRDDDVQPNAVDLRVDRVFEIKNSTFAISADNQKQHRDKEEIFPNVQNQFVLQDGHSYEVLFEGEVVIGPDEAGWVITRSTLNRNGLFITSGLYDSGYHGPMAGALQVRMGTAIIEKGAALGQFLVFKSEALSSYDGDYQKGSGQFASFYEKTVD